MNDDELMAFALADMRRRVDMMFHPSTFQRDDLDGGEECSTSTTSH